MDPIYKKIKNYFQVVGESGHVDSISLNLLFGRIFGIPFPNFTTNRTTLLLYQLYSCIILSFVTVVYTFYELLDIIDAYEDLDALTQNISLSFCHIGGILKTLNVLVHIKDINEIIQILQISYKKYAKTSKQKELLAASEKFNTSLFLAFFGIVFITGAAGAGLIILNPSIAGNAFPYRSKLPTNLPFMVRATYHVLSVLIIGLQIVILDSLNINFINQIRCQLRVLNISLDDLKSKDILNPSNRLRECVQHHEIIIDLRNRIEGIFKYTVLIQFFVSLLIFALTGFQATTREVSSRMAVLYMYTCCASCELFIYCFFANQVIVQNQALAQIGYNSAWYAFDKKFSKSLGIFLIYAQRPVTFSVGGFFDLSLNTFISILSKSYSFIVLLRQVYNE